MTILNKYKNEDEQLKELLLKNLPKRTKAGDEKHLSNIYEYPTIKALNKYKFINFNTKDRISFLVNFLIENWPTFLKTFDPPVI